MSVQAPKPSEQGVRAAVEVRELSPGEHAGAFGLMGLLRPHVAETEFLPSLGRQLEAGYRLVGAFVNGALAGLMGLRPLENFSRGRYLYIDDLIVAPEAQHAGVGGALMGWVKGYAREHRYGSVVLHARPTAVGFYERLGLRPVASPGMFLDVPL